MPPLLSPRANDRLLRTLTPRDKLQLRRILRTAAQDADALLAVLALKDQPVEYGGDSSVMPRQYPFKVPTVPSYDRLKCRDHEVHDAALIAVRVVLGEPAFALYFVEPSPLDTAALHEVLEKTRDRIEDIVVEAYARERAA